MTPRSISAHSRSMSALRTAPCRKRSAGGLSSIRTALLSQASSRSKHPLEDRVDVLEVIAEIEILLDLLGAHFSGHARIGLQEGEEIAFAAPDLHRALLHDPVGVLARQAFLCQRDQHPL